MSHTSDPDVIKRVLLAAAAGHTEVMSEPSPEVEFVEAGLAGLRFHLQVWSVEHLKTAGTLKSDLNFEVWRQLAAAGVVVASVPGSLQIGLPPTR